MESCVSGAQNLNLVMDSLAQISSLNVEALSKSLLSELDKILEHPHGKTLIFVALGVCFVSFVIAEWLAHRERSKQLPPGSTLIDLTYWFLFSPRAGYTTNQLLRDLYNKHGPVFRARITGKPTVVVAGGENYRKLLMKDFESLSNSLPDQVKNLVGPRSMGLIDDPHKREHHKAIRLLWVQHLSPTTINENYLPTMVERAKHHLEAWSQAGAVRFYDKAKELAFDSFAKSALGFSYPQDRLSHLMDIFEVLEQGMWIAAPVNLPGFTYHKSLKAKEEIYRDYIRPLVDRFDAEITSGKPYRSTLIHSFLEFRDEQGKPMGRAEIEDNVQGAFFGALDTTSSSLNSMLMLIDLHREVLQAVREEQREVVARFGPELTPESLAEMHLTLACVKETLRIRTVGSLIFRAATQDIQLGPYLIPKGYTIMPSFELTHVHDSRCKQEGDPDHTHCSFVQGAFKPQRWLNPDTRPLEYYPFSAGPHVCVGQHLAIREMVLFLATLAREYDFEVLDKSLEWTPYLVPKFKSYLPVRFFKL